MARIILMTDFSEAYARRLLNGVSQYVHNERGAWTLVRLPLSNRDKYGLSAVVDYAVKMQADAVIGQFYPDEDVSAFSRKGILAIAQDFKERFTEIPNITADHYKAGVMAADYFISKGFHNFAFYGARNVVWSEERHDGFRDKVLQTSPRHTFSSLMQAKVDLWEYDSEQLATWLRNLPKPVAIMACDDNQAYYITEACRELQINGNCPKVRIPEDIALMGVDNDETICKICSPNLSSLNQDVEKAGYEVARMIDNFTKDRVLKRPDIIVHPSHIVTRQSSDIFVNDNPFIAKVLRYIHENIDSHLTVDSIVELVPMSRRLLETKFKENIGTSIYDYIVKVRMEKVAQMLAEGASVSYAATELGFCDIKNLSRNFKKIMGVTPSQFRKDNESK